MTTGFGLCPKCGTAMTAAGQRFCASCGADVSAIAAPATIPAPPAAPPVQAAPPPPPAWAVPPAASAPVETPAFAVAAPVVAAPAKTGISPTMLLIGGVLIAAIAVGALFVMNNNSKSSGSGPGNSGGNIGGSSVSITPASFSCSGAEVQVTLAIRLSASIPGSTQITMQFDGVTVSNTSVESGFEKQSDGSWLSSAPESSSSLCGSLSPGQHRMSALDANGKVITEGTFTMTP